MRTSDQGSALSKVYRLTDFQNVQFSIALSFILPNDSKSNPEFSFRLVADGSFYFACCQALVCAVKQIMDFPRGKALVISQVPARGELWASRNWVCVWPMVYVYIRQSVWNPKSNTLEPERPHYDRPAACVVAQQYSSSSIGSLPLQ